MKREDIGHTMADLRIDDTVDITDVVCPLTFVRTRLLLRSLTASRSDFKC